MQAIPDKRNPRSICSRMGFAILALVVVSTVAVELLFILLGGFPFFGQGAWGALLLNDIGLYLIALPVFLLILRMIPNGTVAPAWPARLGPAEALLTLVTTLGMLYAGGFVTDLLLGLVSSLAGMAPPHDPMGALISSPGAQLPLFLLVCVTPAVGEEFIFRYMLRKKMRGVGDWNFILFSALSFSLFHANFEQLLYTFLAGLAFSWIYVRTEKIWTSMALHLVVNTLGVIVIPMLEPFLPGWAFIGYTLGCIIAAAAILALFFRRIRAGMVPPSEAGWPGQRARMDREQPSGAPKNLTPLTPWRLVGQGDMSGAHHQATEGVLFGNAGMILYILAAALLSLAAFFLPLAGAIM